MRRWFVLLVFVLAVALPRSTSTATDDGSSGVTSPESGLILMEIDGLSEPRLRTALEDGSMPFLASLVANGSHVLGRWETIGSSSTPVTQAGVLHARNQDIPGYRWWDRDLGRLIEAGDPEGALHMERAVSGPGDLLADGGTSIGNILSGGAERTLATVSHLGGAGLARDVIRFLLDPHKLTGVFVGFGDALRNEVSHTLQGQAAAIDPRAKRKAPVPIVGPALESLLIDIVRVAVVEEILLGTPVVYASLVTYDEVAHYAGLEHAVAADALTRIDSALATIAAAAQTAAPPYRLVVLSDHGQTPGASFESRYQATLEEVIRDLLTDPASADSGALGTLPDLVVAASGNLAHVSFPQSDHRLSAEEIDAMHPGLQLGLASHPGIGVVMAMTDDGELVASGPDGHHQLLRSLVVGVDPLEPYGPHAAESLRHIGLSRNAGDLVVVSMYDTVADEVAPFERQVGSHGGLGGAQTKAILLYPKELEPGGAPIEVIGAEALHEKVRDWMDASG